MHSERGVPLAENAISDILRTLPSRALSHPAMHSLAHGPSRAQYEPVSHSFAVRVLERGR